MEARMKRIGVRHSGWSAVSQDVNKRKGSRGTNTVLPRTPWQQVSLYCSARKKTFESSQACAAAVKSGCWCLVPRVCCDFAFSGSGSALALGFLGQEPVVRYRAGQMISV